MSNEFKVKNGLIVIGDLTTSGTITINGALAATQSWVTSQAYLTSSSLTSYATQSYVTSAIASLVDSAPGALDTLRELATALGNDASFSTTVTNSIAAKLPLAGGTLTGALTGTSATFSDQLIASSTSGGTAAIFRNTGGQNSNGFELRGGTTGSTVNWKFEKDNTVSNAFQLTPSTTNGGTTYTTPVLTIASTGAATFSSSLTVERIQINSTTYEPLAINSSYGQVGLKFGLNGTYFAAIGSANNVTGAYAGSETDLGLGTSGSATANITFATGTGLGRRMTITAGGNVGIGTTSPGYLLDVNGTGRFSGVLYANASFTTTWGDMDRGAGSWRLIPSSGANFFYIQNTTSSYDEIVIDGINHRIGIGNSNPSYKLDVNGTIRTQTGYILGANGSADIIIDGNTGSQLRYGNQKILFNSADAYIYTNNIARLSITNAGIATFSNNLITTNGIADPGYVRITNPEGGISVGNSPVSAAIKIALPANGSFTNIMLSFTVHIFDYALGKTRTLKIAGYTYYNQDWYNMSVYQSGGELIGNINVRFGVEGGRNCVWIGETNTYWSYPNIFITDVQCGHSQTANLTLGWTISLVTTLGTVQNTIVAYTNITTKDIGGTTNYVSKFTGANTLGNSLIFDNGTNIGIGTASPGYKLDIQGIVSVGTTAVGGTLRLEGKGGLSYPAQISTTTVSGIKFSDDSLGMNVVFLSSGNVGIGTTSPAATLDVNGGSIIRGNLTLAGGSRYITGDGGDLFIDTENVSGRDVLLQTVSGQKVGIGTTSPGYKLDVNGTLGVSGTISFPNITISTSGELSFNSSGLNIYTFGRTGLSNAGRIIFNNGTAANLFFGEMASNVYGFTPGAYNSTPVLTMNMSSGNVGIGTASPGADGLTIRREGSDKRTLLQLDRPNTPGLQTNIRFTVSDIMVGQIQHEYVASNYNHMSFTLRSPGGSDIIPLWLENSGNVGIGTSSPANSLEVQGAANTSIQAIFQSASGGNAAYNGGIQLGNAAANQKSSIVHDSSGDNTLTFTSHYSGGSANKFIFAPGGTERVRFQQNGNVGIGNTDPTSQMSGTFGIGIYNALYPAVGFKNSTTAWLWYGQDSTFRMWNVTFGDILTANTSGNIGIGTNSPSTKLDVNGVITATGGNSTNWNTAYSWGNHATAGYLTSYSETDTLASVTNRGNSTTDRINVRGAGNQGGGNIMMGNVGEGTNKWSYLTSTHYNASSQSKGFALIGGLSTDSYNAVVIGGHIYESNPATEIQFWTHSTNTHNLGGTQRGVINSAGNWGIGTTTPGDYRLYVNGGQWGTLLRGGDLGTGSDVVRMIKSDNSVAMIVRGDGNVGIGTTTPQKKLDVFGSAGILASFGSNISPGQFAGLHFGYSESYLNNDSYKKSALVFERTDNHGQGGNASGKIHFLLNNIASASATSLSHSVMVIDTDSVATQGSARVGIGTTSPSTALTVNGVITTTGGNSTNWNTAYSWGNHASGGYLRLNTWEGNSYIGTSGAHYGTVFYDSNDTSYYADPSSTSNLNNLSVVGYQYIGGQTSNGQSNYQWDGADYRNPADWTARLILRKDNATTGINGSIPSLVIFNNNGANQTTASMVFATNECVTGSNSVNLAGIIAKKESVGNCGGWSAGSLNFFVKNYGARVDSLALTSDGNATFSGIVYSTGYGNSSQWNTAYGWGNHASANYIVRGTQIASSADWTTATRFGSVGDISQSAGNHALSVRSEQNNDAFMSFHIGGDYAVHFGLDDTSNRLHTGGWSDGAVKYQLWDSRDFTSTNVSNWNTAYGWGNHASYSYATTSYVTTQINNLIAGAPGALDTLDELAAALGDDSNFATTVTNSIAGKVSKAGDTITTSNNYGLIINHTPSLGDFVDALVLRSTTSGQRAQLGFATVDSDGDHHRASIRAYKGTQTLEGVFGIALRQPGGAHIQRLTLDYLGNLTIGGALTESSSIKLKENVETSEGNLEKVVNLRPVTYNKIGSQTTELGLIAEEVATVYPEFVQYDESGEPVGVNYSRLTAALIGAVKELTQRIETLENNG